MSARPDMQELASDPRERGRPTPGAGPRLAYERDASIPAAFAAQLARRPDAVAVEQGERALTYAQLASAADGIAARLRALDVSPGSAVAVCAARCPEAIVAFLGVLKAGAAYVPLDPELPAARRRLMLELTGAATILAPDAHADGLRGDPCSVLEIERMPPAPPGDEPSEGGARPAYVMFTSGSTGEPKGVEAAHRGILRLALGSDHHRLGPEDAVLALNPLGFDGSTLDIWGTLLNGARLVLPPPGQLSAAIIGRTARHHGITVIVPPTVLFHELVDAGLDGLEGLRSVLVGGDVLSPHRAGAALEALPGCRIVNCYGPTEATCDACAHELVAADALAERVPIGRPLANTTAYVLDPELRPVPPGQSGELWLGGDGIARGYAGAPRLTAERFVADPFDPRLGTVYRTGDRVRLTEDGRLDFLGRLDDQVKIRGFRVEPAEVRAALLEHPQVSAAKVAASEGRGDARRLAAHAVAPGATPGELRDHLATRLPRHMLPARLEVVDRLPAGREPAPAAPGNGRARTEGHGLEAHLCALLAELLDHDEVAPDDDFLALGGDSLIAMQLVARIADHEGVDLPPETVFERATPAALATEVEARRGAGGAGLPPITPAAGPHRFAPLSFAQERAWFFQRLEPESLAYQFQDVLWLEGELNEPALARALRHLVRRHEVLRTTFPWGDGGPVQVIHPRGRVRLKRIDLSGLAEVEREGALRDAVAKRVGRRFEVSRLPLVRWYLFRLAPERHALLHVEHHLLHDGWSWAVFRRELAQLYSAFARGGDPPLAAPRLQFADFCRWQRSVMDSPLAEAQLGYWRRALTPLPPPLELAAAKPRPPRQSFRGGALECELEPGVSAAVHRLGARAGATPFMVMLAAFASFLRAESGNTDLCVGTGVANRRRPESEALIGMALNTVALRVAVEPGDTGLDLLARVRTAVLGALANQDVPFDRVVEMLRPPRESGRLPVYQALFSFDDAPRAPTQAAGLRIVPDERVANLSAKADLNAIVINRRSAGADGLRLLWEYNADLFDRDAAAAMLARYRNHLEALVREPESPAPWSVQAAPERNGRTRPTAERDAPPGPGRWETAIAPVFEERAAAQAGAVAVEAGSTRVTYGELDEAANALAWRLHDLGVRHATPVGVFMERSPELVVSLLAILKAGGAYVPLDPGHPAARTAFMLEDTAVPVVLVQPDLGDRVPMCGAEVVSVEKIGELTADPRGSLAAEAGPDSLAYLMYTSGSTGRPKAVEALQRGVVSLVRGCDFADLGADETLLALAPAGFDASTFEIWGALLNGARLVLAPPGLPTLRELGETIHGHGVTTMWLTAGLFHEMVDGNVAGLRGLRQLLAGGDVLSPGHCRRALEAVPGLRLINGYGPTESTTFACCHELTEATQVDGAVPIGRPVAGRTAHVLGEDGRPVRPGAEGELYIGGAGLARGYHRRPTLTAERFVHDPAGTGERLYHTGDRVRARDDGALEFLGRADDQVKIRGFRVEPGELEVVLGEHPDVAAAAVVVRDDPPRGRRLAAFVVGRAGAGELDPMPWLRERLPDHLLPDTVESLPALPLTPNGKVDRAALRAGAIRPAAPESPGSAAPAGTQRRLAAIWERLLEQPVGPGDDFFALGGHSLLTLRLFAEIELEFGRELPVASIFEAPTLAALAGVIDRDSSDEGWRSLVPMEPGGWKTPFFCVHGGAGTVTVLARLSRNTDPERPFYGLQARGLDGDTRPHRRIEEMAGHYLSEVRRVQRHGPYLLGGICRGAQIAMEMAQQLQAMGEEVTLVAALDARHPQLGRSAERRRRRARRRNRDVRSRAGRAVRRRLARARRLVRRTRRRSWRERAGAALALGRPRGARRGDSVRRAGFKALHEYVARPYSGRVALFESEDSAGRPARRSRAGWERVARGGLDYELVPGNHRSMLREPHVGELARRLSARLDAAEGLRPQRAANGHGADADG